MLQKKIIIEETLPDSRLIQQYIKGDEKSLEILIAKYLKLIYGFVLKNVGNQAVAEDITQEVFIKVWKNIKKFDQRKNFKPWIFQITKNTSIDFLRKKTSIPFSSFENEKGQNILVENLSEKPVNILERLSDKNDVARALSRLQEKEKKLMSLRHIEGMSFREISEILQESVNTIKSRYRRILANFKKKI